MEARSRPGVLVTIIVNGPCIDLPAISFSSELRFRIREFQRNWIGLSLLLFLLVLIIYICFYFSRKKMDREKERKQFRSNDGWFWPMSEGDVARRHRLLYNSKKNNPLYFSLHFFFFFFFLNSESNFKIIVKIYITYTRWIYFSFSLHSYLYIILKYLKI